MRFTTRHVRGERASERVHPLDANHSPGVKVITAINPGPEGKDALRAELRESEKGCKVVGRRRGEGEGSGGLRVAKGCGERRRRLGKGERVVEGGSEEPGSGDRSGFGRSGFSLSLSLETAGGWTEEG